MEWQDISTAPRDGTIIDLWVKTNPGDKGCYRMTDMWWEDNRFIDAGYSFDEMYFSHWMIVTPPTNSTGG